MNDRNHHEDEHDIAEDDGFGVAKYGEASWTHRRLKTPKEGSDRFIGRIIPPYGNLRRSGHWAHYAKLEYGYEVPDSRDATKMRKRPFGCVEQQGRGGMTSCECPKCLQRDTVEKRLRVKMAKLIDEGKSEDEAKDLTADLREWLRSHNIDRKWRIAMMTQEEKLHIFHISHRTKKKLDAEIDRLRRDKTDPIDPNAGVWFEFERTGFGTETDDRISVVMEIIPGPGGRKLQAILPAPISRDMRSAILETLPSLDESYLRLPYKAVQELVDLGESPDVEDVAAVFERFAKPVKEGSSEADVAKEKVKALINETKPQKQDAPKAETPKKTELKATEPAKQEDTVEQKLARLEALERQMAATTAAAAAVQVAKTEAPKKEAPKKEVKAPDEVTTNPEDMEIAAFLSMYPDPSKQTA